jgi:hypothetical protein
VGEQPFEVVSLRVVADEDDGVERVVEPFHHSVPLEAVADQPRVSMKIFGPQVPLAAV